MAKAVLLYFQSILLEVRLKVPDDVIGFPAPDVGSGIVHKASVRLRGIPVMPLGGAPEALPYCGIRG